MPRHNDFGLPIFPRDDARRLLVLLGAIDLLERPSLPALADLLGLDKELIDLDLDALQEQFGLSISRIGEVYRIADWGKLIRPEGVRHLISRSSDDDRSP